MSVTVSIVSHGHRHLVQRLIEQLADLSTSTVSLIIITSNAPQLELFDFDSEFSPIKILFLSNAHPLGFGANHNKAFKHCTSEYFCVLNPDITVAVDPFTVTLATFSDVNVGCAYPWQVNAQAVALDSERELASPWSIGKRHLPWLGKHLRQRATLAQAHGEKPVHWVNGACMVFRSDVFRQLGGFDERYFMYCEDVDICLRLQLAGYKLARADTTVIHDTRRRTLRDLQHFAWHVRSLLRLWGSDAYRDFKQRFVDKPV